MPTHALVSLLRIADGIAARSDGKFAGAARASQLSTSAGPRQFRRRTRPIYIFTALGEQRWPANSDEIGEVITKWLVEDGDDRLMEVLNDFTYEDPATKRWTTPAGWKVDGASIPRALWTIVGSPFTGDYRRASVVHDHYCDVRTEPSDAVHLMFYNACRAAGVGLIEANTLYYGVLAGGPSWRTVRVVNFNVAAAPAPGGEVIDFRDTVVSQPPLDQAKLEQDIRWIAQTNPSLDQIRARASAARSQPPPPAVLQLPAETGSHTLQQAYGQALKSRALFNAATQPAQRR